jgi:Tol biopolymer transport system component
MSNLLAPFRRRIRLFMLSAAALVMLGSGGAAAGVSHAGGISHREEGRLVFTREICAVDTDPCWEIVVADARDTREKVVAGPYTRSVFDDHFIPNWDPNGRSVIFMADLGDGQAIWQVNANGHQLHKVFTAPAGTGLDDGPAFTPDGRHIVFTRCCPQVGGYALWEVDKHGRHLREVTDESVPPGVDGPADGAPQVSPNGKLVAFGHDTADGVNSIATARLAGGPIHILTSPAFNAQAPNWSPDGRHIVFWSASSGANIWAINPDGSDLTQLTFDTHTADLTPSYSPDGSKIIYSHVYPSGDRDLFTMNAGGTHQQRLSHRPGNERFPHWVVVPKGGTQRSASRHVR